MTSRTLSQLRQAVGLSSTEIAARLEISDAALRKAERAPDPRVSSVARFVDALGGSLELTAVFGTDRYELVLAQPPTQPRPASPNTRLAWRIRAWGDRALEQAFLDNGVVAVSEDEIDGDVRHYSSDEDLRAKIHELQQFRRPNALGILVTYWRDFSTNMQIGDTIALPLSGGRVAIGHVHGDYEYDRSRRERLRHHRVVQWLRVLDRNDLDDDLRKTVNSPGTICRFGAHDAATRLDELAQRGDRSDETATR